MAALYDSGKLLKGETKTPWLERLRNDGVYLIDLSPVPVNSLSPAERRIALKDSVEDCVRRAVELAPDGVLICHAPSFLLLAQPIRDAGLPLLHDTAIPFPLGNKRSEFVTKVRVAVAKLPSTGNRFTPPDLSDA